MVVARINFRAQPHQRPEILSVVNETLARMRRAPGCGRSRLYADCDDPNAFTVVSEWYSGDDAEAFISSRDFQLFRGIHVLMRAHPQLIVDEVPVRITKIVR